jgi:hypothetical protein
LLLDSVYVCVCVEAEVCADPHEEYASYVVIQLILVLERAAEHQVAEALRQALDGVHTVLIDVDILPETHCDALSASQRGRMEHP